MQQHLKNLKEGISMQTVSVRIVGIAPLLMNRYPIEMSSDTKAKRRDEQYSPEKDAEKALYRDEEIGCYAPSAWLEACLRDVAKGFKAARGKGTLKGTVLASVFVEPEKIPFHKRTFDEIDIRPVVIMKNRVVKGRPRFNSWSLEFKINYDENRIEGATLKQLMEEAGITKGIGDYRPKFGRFKVVGFE
jgi:hypothetical protein